MQRRGRAWQPLPAAQWDEAAARHLLQRIGFSATPAETARTLKDGPAATLAGVLRGESLLHGVAAAEFARHLGRFGFERGDEERLGERGHVREDASERGGGAFLQSARGLGGSGAEADALEQVARGGLVPLGGGQRLPRVGRRKYFEGISHGPGDTEETPHPARSFKCRAEFCRDAARVW